MEKNKRKIAFTKIRGAIIEARDNSSNISLYPNYNSGIEICNDIIDEKDDQKAIQLITQFNRYVADCLPWEGRILETINKEM
jgi:hypothetical protein